MKTLFEKVQNEVIQRQKPRAERDAATYIGPLVELAQQLERVERDHSNPLGLSDHRCRSLADATAGEPVPMSEALSALRADLSQLLLSKYADEEMTRIARQLAE